ncbi:MAG: FAD-binding oxidoreductase [Sulfitobacter sp.]|nr:FAD-binding oxidoreductase [Sulfitobacter sp.]
MSLNPADPAFADHLATLLPQEVFRPLEPRYFEEPRGLYKGQAGVLALPRDVEEVSRLVREAAKARVGVVPYGGGTGLVGGQVQTDGPAPLLISLERMNRVRAIYPDENVIVTEAGVVLADLQRAAREAGRLFPLSLAAEGTARIGGNLATNAGGTGVLRYGNARDLCLGIEAVLPDGQIFHGLRRLRKDNTGYDLRHLLVGAEGTLGIITAASLKLYPQPARMGTALFVVESPAAALKLLAQARVMFGEMISAFELMHRQGMDFLAEHLPQVRLPFGEAPEWSVLIDIGASGGLDPQKALEQLFAAGLEAGLLSDGLVALSDGQAADFWRVREHLPEANRLVGSVSSHDISLPLGLLPDFINEGREMVAEYGPLRINCFGHVGDGNLHYNVFPPKGEDRAAWADRRADISGAIHALVHRMEGSISAEHGIGRAKVADLELYGDPVKLATMRTLKNALDPAGIMNPGAVLRAG